MAFDILYKNKCLTNLCLLERKKILNHIKDNDFFIKSRVFNYNGIDLFNHVKKYQLEGIVAKSKDSKYEINTRSANWIKIKNNKEEEFIIGGYIEKKNGISLLLGEYVDDKLSYVGSVILTRNLHLYNNVLVAKKISRNPFYNYDNNNATFIKLKLKCHIKYLERTKNNHLRQPVIKR